MGFYDGVALTSIDVGSIEDFTCKTAMASKPAELVRAKEFACVDALKRIITSELFKSSFK